MVTRWMTTIVSRQTQVLRFKQNTVDTDLRRSFEFYRVDGDFYMTNVRNDLPRDGVEISYKACYRINDPRVKEILQNEVDWVNGRLLEKDYTKKSY